tara:strand:- start:500 stop:1672 length:1173 start_codon:yes stop_codon:yes gene_type:complete
MVKRKITKRKRKVTKRKRRFGPSAALKAVKALKKGAEAAKKGAELAKKGAEAANKVAEIKGLMEKQHYVGALKKIDDKVTAGITALTTQLTTIENLTIDSPVFNDFMKPVLEGLKIDLDGVKGFATTKAKIEATKEKLKAMTVVDVKGLTGQYDKIKTKIMGIESLKKDTNIQEMQKIINTFTVPGFNLQDKLRESLPSALLLFLIEKELTPATNKALATFTAEKITAAKAVATTPQGSFGRRKKMSQEKRIIKIQKISKELSKKMSREEILSITAISINALAILAGLSAFLLNKGKRKVDHSGLYVGPGSGFKPTYVVKDGIPDQEGDYGNKYDVLFGKRKKKKLSAALKRMCKKYKVRLTTKRNGKNVYKSEKVLKKQCKNALKRRKK